MLTACSIDERDEAQAGPGGAGAFSLIELLVVIAVIALLLAVLLPSLAVIKERGRRTVCKSNVRQFIVGLHVYANENEHHLPNPA